MKNMTGMECDSISAENFDPESQHIVLQCVVGFKNQNALLLRHVESNLWSLVVIKGSFCVTLCGRYAQVFTSFRKHNWRSLVALSLDTGCLLCGRYDRFDCVFTALHFSFFEQDGDITCHANRSSTYMYFQEFLYIYSP